MADVLKETQKLFDQLKVRVAALEWLRGRLGSTDAALCGHAVEAFCSGGA